jgi:hypothetical protein
LFLRADATSVLWSGAEVALRCGLRMDVGDLKSKELRTFAALHAALHDPVENRRDKARKALAKFLSDRGLTHNDIPAIFARIGQLEAASAPPPPPNDPRDAQPNPFEDPAYTPAGLVRGIVEKYLTMEWHVAVIYSLWLVFTHVYLQFEIAPRLVMVSEGPDAGKSTARKVASHLVYRPNEEALGTAAAIRDYLDHGPGTILLDELDYLDADARRQLLKLWNLGHERGAKISLMVKGRRKLVSIHAPILGAGIGDVLERTQQTRTFRLDMEPYTQETKPERRYDSSDVADLNAVYSYLRNWARNVKLNPDPDTAGLIRRFADNARGLLAVADSCGREWGRLARDAVMVFADREKAEQPHLLIVKHGLAIFDAAGLDQAKDVISTVQFNRELRLLEFPDAHWSRYRGAGGMAYPHPITVSEQAALLRRKPNKIASFSQWPGGKRIPGMTSSKAYRRGDFEAAWRKHEAAKERAELRLRLVTPISD